MRYALLCYHVEDEVAAWPEAREAAIMARLDTVQRALARAGKLGPVARLMPTSTAATLRRSDPPLVIDGPFAETREQLLGFYMLECTGLEEALAIAGDLARANPGGCYEVRPVENFLPGPA